MTLRTLFVTGRLAEPRLRAVLAEFDPAFEYEIWNAGVKVAALITESILLSRLPRPIQASQVILPGRCRANIYRLTHEFSVPFVRGPDELKDLPVYFGRRGRNVDLTRHNLRLFAEIVDASTLPPEDLIIRAHELVLAGADVIDLGCLPDSPFPHLEHAVRMLRDAGYSVSVDSANPAELQRAASAGADYLLSLNEFTVELGHGSRPILVPATHGDSASLIRAYERAKALGIEPIIDPILDPIHFGFVDSIARYRELRNLLPEAEMMMGTGNLTELTEVDTAGLTALLIGVCSELRIANALTVNVSSHTRRTLQEHDAARRLMFAAKEELSWPKGFGGALLQIHDRAPFPNDPEEITAAASQVKDRNFRIEVATNGVHIFNRDGHWTATNAFELFASLDVETDGAHAFYLGAELQKAEIAYRLGKRYVQDEPLDWGVAVDRVEVDRTRLADAGQTLQSKATKCL
jgi:dihydropteroate synthase-like protein